MKKGVKKEGNPERETLIEKYLPFASAIANKVARALASEAFDAPAAFIVGNEGHGVREKTLAACDISLAIPMGPRSESLNAAASAAIVFYEWSKKHPGAVTLHTKSGL